MIDWYLLALPHLLHTSLLDSHMDSTGARIKAAREQAVYGQAELARAAGITPNALWQIEKGLREPRPATIRKIAAALNLEPSRLVPDREKRLG